MLLFVHKNVKMKIFNPQGGNKVNYVSQKPIYSSEHHRRYDARIIDIDFFESYERIYNQLHADLFWPVQ